jgi:hypothetical protein
MKTNSVFLLLLALTATRLAAETLAGDTAVFLSPDPKSPVIARLKAGASIVVIPGAPAGWRQLEVSGPFEVFAQNRDVTKGLEVREGANLYVQPRKDAPILTVAGAEDKTDVTGLVRGSADWARVKLDKKLRGYIAVGETANQTAAVPTLALPAPATGYTPPPPSNAPGRPVAIKGNSADLPRLFQGRLVSARTLLQRSPLYDYQLSDSSGRRLAYLNLEKLKLAGKVETYLERTVSVTGTMRNTIDGKDLVIEVESLQLK